MMCSNVRLKVYTEAADDEFRVRLIQRDVSLSGGEVEQVERFNFIRLIFLFHVRVSSSLSVKQEVLMISVVESDDEDDHR